MDSLYNQALRIAKPIGYALSVGIVLVLLYPYAVDGSFFTWKMLRFALGAMFFQSLFQSLISYRKKKEDDLGKYEISKVR